MTPEQRLRWIQRVESQGYTVDAYEHRDMMLVGIRDGHGYIVNVMASNRFDWEQAARDFDTFQQRGSKRHTTRKLSA